MNSCPRCRIDVEPLICPFCGISTELIACPVCAQLIDRNAPISHHAPACTGFPRAIDAAPPLISAAAAKSARYASALLVVMGLFLGGGAVFGLLHSRTLLMQTLMLGIGLLAGGLLAAGFIVSAIKPSAPAQRGDAENRTSR